jgi:hypothetical protein
LSVFSPSPADGVFRQGEIVSDVIQVHLRVEALGSEEGDVDLEEKLHPFALLLTQDCDLDWDFKARAVPLDESEPDIGKREKEKNKRQAKLVPNVLLCELTTVDLLRPFLAGSDILRRIRGNLDERYHCLPQSGPEIDREGEGLPELVADFKRVFSIPTDELYFRMTLGLKRRAILQSPHLQHLSSRFGYYCLRVAIPDALIPPAPQPVAPIALQPPAPEGRGPEV